MADETLSRYTLRARIAYWRWRLRFWWAWLPWVQKAYLDGYYSGWTDHRVMPDYHDPGSAWNEWVSRLGE